MKLLLNGPFTFSAAERHQLQSVRPELVLDEVHAGSPEELDGSGVTILVTELVPRNLATWPDLRWVQLLSAGANQLLNHPIQQSSVAVTTASGTHGVPIAQYVTCNWLMMVHRMPRLLEFKSSRTWPDRGALEAFSVRGLTVGIIGYGSIGRECARQLNALGMHILCLKHDPKTRSDGGYNAWPETGDPDGKIPESWFGPDQLREMLPSCDLVVVTAPSTPRTEGMIGKAELALLKKTARMIIISRGGIVVEHALAEALRAGQFAEAVVDCYVGEPIGPDHFLFDVPGLIMTPHMSGVYDLFWPAMFGLLAENLRRFSAAIPLLNPAHKKNGY